MTQNRNLSILADNVSSAGVLTVAGGGTGLATTPSNGQLNIGNGTGFTRATISAGTGITVTNGAGTITIANTGGAVAATQLAKAWVNFNGTLTTPITPRANYNVSSITKNATGDYTLNFTTALADANYTIVGSCSVFTTGTGGATVVEIYDAAGGGTNPTTSAARIYVHRSGVSAVDATYVCVNVFGN